MKIRFTKMQGCGNDYVYINGFTEKVPQEKKPEFVRFASDRHFGIGGDGVIFINPSDEADFEMEMYNADGTRAEMCGNGIRCVAKYVHDKGLTDQTQFSIVSGGKVKYMDLTVENGITKAIRVDMGEPILTAAEVPVVSKNEQSVDEEIVVDNEKYRMTCVSMGNPHAVASGFSPSASRRKKMPFVMQARCSFCMRAVRASAERPSTSATAVLSYGGCSVFKKISIISICGCMLRR